MIAEAVDTAIALGWALAAWIVVGALVVTVAAYTLLAVVCVAVWVVWRAGVWAWKAARRAFSGPVSASRALRAHGEGQPAPDASQGRVRLPARVPPGASTATGPRSPLDGRLTPELRSRVPVEPEPAERPSEPRTRKEAA